MLWFGTRKWRRQSCSREGTDAPLLGAEDVEEAGLVGALVTSPARGRKLAEYGGGKGQWTAEGSGRRWSGSATGPVGGGLDPCQMYARRRCDGVLGATKEVVGDSGWLGA